MYFYATKSLRRIARSTACFYLEKEWGFSEGDLVCALVWRVSDGTPVDYVCITRKALRSGSGLVIVMPTKLGFEVGDLVTVRLNKMEKTTDAEMVF